MDKRGLLWIIANALINSGQPERVLMPAVVDFAYKSCAKRGFIRDDQHNDASPILQYLSQQDYEKISELFDSLTLSSVQELVFELLYPREKENAQFSEYNLSLSIANLFHSLLMGGEKKDERRIIDLCAGTGGFLASYLQKDNSSFYLTGCERTYEQTKVVEMALAVLGVNSKSIIEINSDGYFSIDVSEKFDSVFCFPPLGIYIDPLRLKNSLMFPEIALGKASDWYFVDRAVSLLNESGKALVVISGRSLWDKQSKEYRERLINSGWISKIIEFPDHFFPNLFAKTCALVLSRGNASIEFINASNILPSVKAGRIPEFDVKEIISKLEKIAISKSNNEVIGISNLCPSKVCLRLESFDNGRILGDIAGVFPGCQYTQKKFECMLSDEDTGYKILTSNDIGEYSMKTSLLKSIKVKDTSLDKFVLKYGDVVLTSKSSKVKIAVVDFEPAEKIIVTGGMIIVRPDAEILDSTYLKILLSSSLGKRILESIQKGMTIISFTPSDLAKIEIPVPPIEKQKALSTKYTSKVSALIAYLLEVDKLEDELSNFDLEMEDNE